VEYITPFSTFGCAFLVENYESLKKLFDNSISLQEIPKELEVSIQFRFKNKCLALGKNVPFIMEI